MSSSTSSLTRRRLLHGLSLPLLVPALAACGGGADETPLPPPAAPEPRFSSDGLAGRIVRRLRPPPDGLLAPTDEGAWRRSAAGHWQPIGPAPVAVNDIVAIAPGRYLASFEHFVGDVPVHGLLETDDGGTGWRRVENNFGGDDDESEALHALAYDTMGGRLLATGHDVLAESRDLGRSWQLLAGQWQGIGNRKEALAFDPARGDVWYGGQDAIEGFALFRRRQGSGVLDRYPGLMASPSVAKGIRLVGGQPGRVLVSGEGGIVQTFDDGARWQTLLHDSTHRFYFDVLHDVQRPQRFVTAGWDKNFDEPQPLVVEVSDDDGRSWQRHVHPDRNLYGGAWSMALQTEQGRSVCYLGLYRGGVMRLEWV